MEDTEVSAGTVCDLGGDGAEKLTDSVLVLEITEDDTAVVRGVFLALGDKRFHIGLECLGLGLGGYDPLVEDKRGSHVGEEGLAAGRGKEIERHLGSLGAGVAPALAHGFAEESAVGEHGLGPKQLDLDIR